MENQFCPYLGSVEGREPAETKPANANRCYAQRTAAAVDGVHQSAYCLTAAHARCALNLSTAPLPAEAEEEAVSPGQAGQVRRRARAVWAWAFGAVALVAVLIVYGGDLLRPGAPAAPPPAAAPASVAASETPAGTPVPASAPAAADARTPGALAPDLPRRVARPTAEAGGSVVVLQPEAGGSGWWASSEGRSEHLDDSFLYAGVYKGQAMISAVRFDLRRVRRGAPIREATLSLSGLNGERFNAAVDGSWAVQFLDPKTQLDLARSDFQALYNAPAAITLLPPLAGKQLAAGAENRFALDGPARAWLNQQILDGIGTLTIRISGPGGGESTLFAWDSGTGPETKGNGPQLVLSLGAAPATPPPLPTERYIVATLTPTPANVATAAAQAATAAALETTIGTATPVLYAYVTPTPLPENLATAQAQALLAGLPPIVIYTPVPANKATLEANASYATAVAVTTGTFTPVPTNAITPIVIMPTVVPENAATAAAQMMSSTARARENGTPTARPYGVLVATPTPGALVIASTATPANVETAVAHAVNATAVAMTTGTFTPTPAYAVTPTPPPGDTPLPLLIRVTPRATPTATPALPSQLPAELAGKILFHSDRDGGQRLFALDPASQETLWVTKEWPFELMQAREGLSPDGKLTAYVENDPDGVPQVYVRNADDKSVRQITQGKGWSYDVAWSPTGDRLAFVSQAPGNDEIFSTAPDGSDVRRLTNNNWEWDKHPSWSPDGKQIVFWSNRETGSRQLWVMDADGSNQRLLLISAYNDWDPVWVK